MSINASKLNRPMLRVIQTDINDILQLVNLNSMG